MRFIYTLLVLLVAHIGTSQTPQINLVQLATGFNSPVDIKHCGDNRIFVVQQGGAIRILSKSGTINSTPFITIDSVLSSGNEQGLLGLAFSPNYKQDGYFYVNYTFANGTTTGETRISRFSVNPTDSNLASPNTEKVILSFTQPYTNHNGGNMMFGPDGYLYISSGDGGSGGDPQGYAQNKNTLLGKMLRIDVTGQSTYAIPPTNPFVGQPNVKEEIWSYGLRNPWRCSFDRITGDMWIGDVGQLVWEEIDFEPAGDTGGRNYGWKCYEGNSVYSAGSCSTVAVHAAPVFVFGHTGGNCSVTGGYVYRGTQFSALFGRYIFTDYCSGQFWSTRKLANGNLVTDTLQDFFNNQFTAYGEDNLGEMYVAYRGSGSGGRIYKITETGNCNPVAYITDKDTITSCTQTMLTALYGDSLSYEWYNSNSAIPGANTNQLQVTTSDWYYVGVSKIGNGCKTFSDSVYVQINDTTELQTPNTAFKYCLNTTSVSLTPNVTPNGGNFSSPFVTGSSFQPTLAGSGAHAVYYTYTNTDGCISYKALSVNVIDTTELVALFTLDDKCIDAPAFSLDGYVTFIGGTYSGSGVANNIYNPSSAGLGASNLLYNYTDGNGCTSTFGFGWNVVNCVGLEKFESNQIQIFPNPTNASIAIRCTTADIHQVDIYDMTGRNCLHKQIAKGYGPPLEFDVAELAKGVYEVKIFCPANTYSVKLIKD